MPKVIKHLGLQNNFHYTTANVNTHKYYDITHTLNVLTESMVLNGTGGKG